MHYTVEVYDAWNRRIAAYDEVPLLEVTRGAPDETDRIRGLLPKEIQSLGTAYRVRVLLDGAPVCEAPVTWIGPQWGDTKKLILERYIPFHEIVEFEAETEARRGNSTVSRAWTNREIGGMVKELINSARGEVHYTVAHSAYPDGAQREYMKLAARMSPENELEVGGISTGQWVGADRIDATGAYAKDGDTIAGLVVDGEAWPDLRLMLVDCEESSRNSHAISRHPEVAFWSDAQYNASGYKRRADAATAFLQHLLDTKGIDYIELNPHKDATGAFDDRVDAYGRYLGLVYGGGECFNAALVEQGHAEVYLYDDGRYLDPALELKDFFSYAAPNTDSIETTGIHLAESDVTGGVLEVLTALAYAAGGYIFSVTPDLAVAFRKPETPDHALYYAPKRMAVQFGSSASELANIIVVEGHPFTGAVNHLYARGESIDTYGKATRFLTYFSLSRTEDAEKVAEGLLDDLAYPETSGVITIFRGAKDYAVGDLIELRGAPIRRLDPPLAGEHAGRFAGRHIARIRGIVHRLSGKHVQTELYLSSPLRSVRDPIAFITRSQESASSLFEFRLDEATVGVDMGFHLD